MPGTDQFTKTMLHMDGSNGSTTFTDSELTPKTWTAHGAAAISTSQSVFGGASGLFTAATSDYIDTVSNLTDFNFGTGDLTIDCRVRTLSTGATKRICGDLDVAGSAYSVVCFLTSADLPVFIVSTAAGDFTFTATNALSANTFYHLAFVRYGPNLLLFINGTLETNSSGNPAIGVNAAKNMQGNTWSVGTHGDFRSNFFNGYIDELRVSKGIARWTANFTPPASAYDSINSRMTQGIIF